MVLDCPALSETEYLYPEQISARVIGKLLDEAARESAQAAASAPPRKDLGHVLQADNDALPLLGR